MFVCHGNICRSPMAEFLMKDMVQKLGKVDEFYIQSSATSREEIYGISVVGKYARQLTVKDYEEFDYIIAMDSNNLRNIDRIIGSDRLGKVSLLLDYAGCKGQSIADPWYTGDFDVTYDDIMAGLKGLLKHLGY